MARTFRARWILAGKTPLVPSLPKQTNKMYKPGIQHVFPAARENEGNRRRAFDRIVCVQPCGGYTNRAHSA